MNHNLHYYLYMDVKVVKSGKVGIVIDVNENEGKVLVEFDDCSRSWEFESDIVEIALYEVK